MNTILLILPVAFLIVSVFFVMRSVKRGAKKRVAVVAQILTFVGVCAVVFAVPAIAQAFVATGTTATATAATTAAAAANSSKGLEMIAAALATGLAGIGGGIAVAAAAPAAIGATSEDPKSFGKSLIFVVLGEGIAIYGLLISILIINKI